MEKIVKFYKIFAEPSISINGTQSNSEKIKTIFQTMFDKPVSNNFSYIYSKDNSTFRFDIKEKTEQYIFGTFCKEEHFEDDLLLQTRDIQDNSTGPYTPNPDESVERFTYFLIDYNAAVMVAIHNHNLPRIYRILPEFIWDTSSHCMSLSIEPYAIENLEEHLKKFKKCKDLTITFYQEA